MASARQEFIERLLRDVRFDVSYLREKSEEHSRMFLELRKEIHDWQETTATSAGFAMHANLRNGAIEAEVEALKQRVENLEKTK